MKDTTSKSVMKDIRAGVSPKKYESLDKRTFGIIKALYYKHNIKALIRYLANKGLSQNEISKKLGISQSSVTRKLKNNWPELEIEKYEGGKK